MKSLRRSLLGMLVWISPLVQSQVTTCPWMNQATAAGVLGGPVSLSVDATEDTWMDNSICRFHSAQGTLSNDFSIEVKKLANVDVAFDAYKKQCVSAPVTLQAIGNEAYLCTVASGKNVDATMQSASVIGRVRDHAFIVTLSMSTKLNPPLTNDDIKNKANSVAEQVAGALY